MTNAEELAVALFIVGWCAFVVLFLWFVISTEERTR